MNWKIPSKNYPYLELPILQISPKVSEAESRQPIIRVDVSETFIDTWNSPITNTEDPKELHDKMVILGDAFCNLIRTGQQDVSTSEKGCPNDLVTEMDQGIEMLLRLWLNQHYPTHKIIGEEGYKDDLNSDDVAWYLDPIDGTVNFINGEKDVAVHIGCIRNNAPWVSYIGCPFLDTYYSGYHNNPTPTTHPFTQPKTLVIGAEYLPDRGTDEVVIHKLIKEKGIQTHRVKSIGIHILDMLKGKVTAFFKSRIKLWDVIPPIEILDFYQPGKWEAVLYVPINFPPKSKEDFKRVSIYTNNQDVLTHFNEKNKTHSRVGTVIITPKDRKLEDMLFDEVIQTCYA